MEWLVENWGLVLFFGGMAAMHLFGHGKKHAPKMKPVVIPKETSEARSGNQSWDRMPSNGQGLDQRKPY